MKAFPPQTNMNESGPETEIDATTAQMTFFLETAEYVREYAGQLQRLIERTEDIIDAVDWGMEAGPDQLDQRMLPHIAAGVTDGIEAILEISMNGEVVDWDRTYLAQESFCEWRTGFGGTARAWLSGWFGSGDPDRSLFRVLGGEFRASWRLVGFVLRFFWLMYLASFRLDCSPMDDEEEQEIDEEFIEETQVEEVGAEAPETELEEEEDQLEEAIILPAALTEDDETAPAEVAVVAEVAGPEPCEALYEELAGLVELKTHVRCPDEQVSAAQERLAADPFDADCRAELAACYAQGDAYPLAIQEFADVLTQRPESHRARKQYIYCLARLMQWEEVNRQIEFLAGYGLHGEEAEDLQDLIENIRAECDGDAVTEAGEQSREVDINKEDGQA